MSQLLTTRSTSRLPAQGRYCASLGWRPHECMPQQRLPIGGLEAAHPRARTERGDLLSPQVYFAVRARQSFGWIAVANVDADDGCANDIMRRGDDSRSLSTASTRYDPRNSIP